MSVTCIRPSLWWQEPLKAIFHTYSHVHIAHKIIVIMRNRGYDVENSTIWKLTVRRSKYNVQLRQSAV